MPAPLVVLSDLHLSHSGSERTLTLLSELVGERAGHEIVLNGDVFGLSSDPPDRDPVESVRTLLARKPELVRALHRHVTSGAALTFVAGNHDAALGGADMRKGLLALLELTDAAPLAVEPWFIRRGQIHVEHGHVWDPDNAPVHPLAPASCATEPLGIQLTRRFVAKNDVWQFAHAHETTLVAGIQRAFRLFGARAPLLVLRYFATSSQICAETLRDRGIRAERALGDAELAAQSQRSGVGEATLRELLARSPEPTHVDFATTFLRLYFDRVFASVGVAGGALGLVLARSSLAGAAALASGVYLGWNVKHAGARYQNLPVRRLRDGARVVKSVTEAPLVVFGHTHVPEIGDGYANAGSFGYPAPDGSRTYLVLEPESGRAELQRKP